MRLILFSFVFIFLTQSFAQKSLNSPNVSANALFLYQNSNFAKENTDTVRNGIDLQEAEIAFYSDVDPYTRLNILLAVSPEYEPNGSVVEQKWNIEPEELYVETLQVPLATLRIGKFKAAFGKHNQLHTHAFPFVDAPLVNSGLLGEEGLNDVGISAALLLPAKWFSELSFQYLRGEGENTEFNSPTPSDGVYVAKWKNLWDVSDDLTVEFGASYAQGRNFAFGNTSLNDIDLTFKWRPTQGGKYFSGILGAELINRKLEQPAAAQDEKGSGWNVWGQYQIAQRWALAGRTENLKIEGSAPNPAGLGLNNITTTKNSLGLIFNATEFSSYRMEYSQTNGPTNADGETVEKKIYLQANFTIGAHPAHSY